MEKPVDIPEEEQEEEEEEDQEQEQAPPQSKYPLHPLYCEVCGLPAEYCEYGPSFQKCKPWLAQHAAELYPSLASEGFASTSEEADLASKLESASLSHSEIRFQEKQLSNLGQKAVTDAKIMPGGKLKKKAPSEVLIKRVQRNKRKWVTHVIGLDTFESIKLPEVCKVFKQKFACGATVDKTAQVPTVEIQGDVGEGLVDLLVQKYKIPVEVIFMLEGQQKIPAAQ